MERELWRSLYLLARKLGNPQGSWRYSTAEVLGVYFWAVVHDRPTNWATDPNEWPCDMQPEWLPSQSTMSRRLRKPETVELMTAVEQQLVTLLALGRYLVHIVDGKALAVSAVSKDRDTGYGRGAGAPQKGYKLHAIWSGGPIPVAWALAPMNTSEKTMARRLIPTLLGGGYLLGDVQYDVSYLYELATEAGFQLVAQKTKGRGLGHRRQPAGRLRSIELLQTQFGRELYQQRSAIECRFGTLTSLGGGLGPLPAWVRHFNRVRNWVQAKILAVGVRWLLNNQPQMLALA
jgi:Transposase DDE domain